MTRDVPQGMSHLYDRTQAGTASPRQAIKMQCYECCGYDRDEVRQCTDAGCPLFRYRPGVKRRSEVTHAG